MGFMQYLANPLERLYPARDGQFQPFDWHLGPGRLFAAIARDAIGSDKGWVMRTARLGAPALGLAAPVGRVGVAAR
ncbi:hypothetical protein AQZ49_07280 [Novosphingobium sp. FSW06-99]|nr:hypothetical protein AQZ49_07280 [Novosphingobium sp. FSW06-99]